MGTALRFIAKNTRAITVQPDGRVLIVGPEDSLGKDALPQLQADPTTYLQEQIGGIFSRQAWPEQGLQMWLLDDAEDEQVNNVATYVYAYLSGNYNWPIRGTVVFTSCTSAFDDLDGSQPMNDEVSNWLGAVLVASHQGSRTLDPKKPVTEQ